MIAGTYAKVFTQVCGVAVCSVQCAVVVCVAVCCSVLQCVALCYNVERTWLLLSLSKSSYKCLLLQCAVCCFSVAMCCSVLLCVAVCCEVDRT